MPVTFLSSISFADFCVFIGFVGYGLFRIARAFFGKSPEKVMPPRELPMPDPYYQAALRELDTHLGASSPR